MFAAVSVPAAAAAQGPPAPAADGSGANPAAEAPEPAAPPLPSAPRVLAAARRALDLADTVSATLSQRVALGPAAYAAAGTFASARGGRVRLELTANDGGGGPDLLQVCDADILHTQYVVDGAVAVTRRNVRAVREAAADTSNPPLAESLALGGLAGLLATLESGMRWKPVKRRTVRGADLLVLDGRWTRGARRGLKARYGGSLPEFTPDGAKVYLAADSLVPRRVLYWRKDGSVKGGRRTLMALDFENVRLNAPLPPDLFTYAAPADADEDDVTAKAVARLTDLGKDDAGEDDTREEAGDPAEPGATE